MWTDRCHDNLYGAVIRLKALREFTLVRVMSAAWRQIAAADTYNIYIYPIN